MDILTIALFVVVALVFFSYVFPVDYNCENTQDENFAVTVNDYHNNYNNYDYYDDNYNCNHKIKLNYHLYRVE